jgi:hypothetical protein
MFSSGSIDLGAPILEVASSTSIAVTTGSTYIPVTISSPTYSQSNTNEANVFSPVGIVTQTQVTYKNQTVQVEMEPDTVV